jgi:hypothetical protein
MMPNKMMTSAAVLAVPDHLNFSVHHMNSEPAHERCVLQALADANCGGA